MLQSYYWFARMNYFNEIIYTHCESGVDHMYTVSAYWRGKQGYIRYFTCSCSHHAERATSEKSESIARRCCYGESRSFAP